MPLNSVSPASLHRLQNALLILVSLLFAPLLSTLTVVSRLIAPYSHISHRISHHRKWRTLSSSTFRPRTILVTGVGMSKGLTLARSLYISGHRVIGADFEPYYLPVCGRFSVSLSKFYRVVKPTQEGGSATYIQDLLSIIRKEKVELWVSCSGVASALEDGEAAEAIEKETSCLAIQFGHSLTETLHEKHSFITHTQKIGLTVPATHLVTSESSALAILYPRHSASSTPAGSPTRVVHGRKYIMKSVGLDDSIRADMTLLPRPTQQETSAYIKRMAPSPFRPFVLQQFIQGPEYCTHSLLVKGQVKTFVACPSAELLMHYSPLPASSALSQAMYAYTVLYARKTLPAMTGHFSIDFLVHEDVAREWEGKIGVSDRKVRELMEKIYPIECNPRAHTAVVAFSSDLEVMSDMADAYLSVLPSHEPKGMTNGHRADALVVPKPGSPPTYWIGHDIVTKLILPILFVLRREVGITDCLASWMEFAEHVLYWRDGTWELWDPWPLWWLYCVYWPGMCVLAIWEQRWWSRVNVSTGKMFSCR